MTTAGNGPAPAGRATAAVSAWPSTVGISVHWTSLPTGRAFAAATRTMTSATATSATRRERRVIRDGSQEQRHRLELASDRIERQTECFEGQRTKQSRIAFF